MFKTFKIIVMILGLGIFILPKQTAHAQNVEQFCNHKTGVKDCCKSEKNDSCHSKSSKKNSNKNSCGDDCNNCNSCTVHFVSNFISAELTSTLRPHFFVIKMNFDYGIPYFNSTIENIWQPPKLS